MSCNNDRGFANLFFECIIYDLDKLIGANSTESG
jgi:hypothetical protein